MSAATPEVRIALAFHHARSCASGRADCFGGRVLRAAIALSLARARSETTGRNRGSSATSTGVTSLCPGSARQAVIWSLRRAVQRISSCGTPTISIMGRRPGVTVRDSAASPSASHTSAATSSLQSAEAATLFSYQGRGVDRARFPVQTLPLSPAAADGHGARAVPERAS